MAYSMAYSNGIIVAYTCYLIHMNMDAFNSLFRQVISKVVPRVVVSCGVVCL